MASYFDEHDCEPLDSEQEARTNMLLELARWARGARSGGPGGRFLGWGWLENMDYMGQSVWGGRMNNLES